MAPLLPGCRDGRRRALPHEPAARDGIRRAETDPDGDSEARHPSGLDRSAPGRRRSLRVREEPGRGVRRSSNRRPRNADEHRSSSAWSAEAAGRAHQAVGYPGSDQNAPAAPWPAHRRGTAHGARSERRRDRLTSVARGHLMEVSEVRKRIKEVFDRAKRSKSDRRTLVDDATRDYQLFLDQVATPLFKQIANVLRAEGTPFTISTPGGAVRLVSDR